MDDHVIGLASNGLRRARLWPISFGLGMALLAGNAAAAMPDENLLLPLPAGFKIVTQQRNDHATLTEMVPSAESADQWTQMVTSQIYFGAKDMSFDAYKSATEERWKPGCDATASAPVAAAKENGYDFRIWLQSCRFNDPQRSPWTTWFKMIHGSDNTYVVQVTSHTAMAPDEIKQWMMYLQKVMVCDSRLKQLACPSSK